MSETQKFAEIEKTLEGLRGLSDLPEEERKKNPGMIKYKEELNKLNKKDREEFFEKSYQDSKNDKEWQEQKLLEEKEGFKTRFISEEDLHRERVQNIGVPETVDIDYSEIKDIPVAKTGGSLRPYKDGFLIVRDEIPNIISILKYLITYLAMRQREEECFFTLSILKIMYIIMHGQMM